MHDTLDQAADHAQRSAIEWQTHCYVYRISEGGRSRYMVSLVCKPDWVYRASCA